MTIRDVNLIYSRAQAVLLAGDTASTNIFDAGSIPTSDIRHRSRGGGRVSQRHL